MDKRINKTIAAVSSAMLIFSTVSADTAWVMAGDASVVSDVQKMSQEETKGTTKAVQSETQSATNADIQKDSEGTQQTFAQVTGETESIKAESQKTTEAVTQDSKTISADEGQSVSQLPTKTDKTQESTQVQLQPLSETSVQEVTKSDTDAVIQQQQEEPADDTAVSATSGTWGTCKWKIENGVLYISGGYVGSRVSYAQGWRDNNEIKESVKKVKITGKITFESGTSLSFMFSGLRNMTSIEGLANLDTSNVALMDDMFAYCEKLQSIDISKFNTANVTSMASMFYCCKNLQSINVSNFNTSKVTEMGSMFSGCSNLTNITGLNKFNTSKVKNMYGMFGSCESLNNIDVSSFDTSNVERFNSMFYGCKNLTKITGLNKWNTSKAENMSYMFQNCEKLQSIDVSSFNTSNVTGMSYMFNNCKALTGISGLEKFNTAKVEKMCGMFYGCGSLQNVNVSKFNTSKVTDMSYMFYGCENLQSINLSNFNTSNVTNMEYMFYNCKKAKTIDVSKFNTSKVESMLRMFWECNNVTKLDVSKFNTKSVVTFGGMFNGCKSLTDIDVSNFNTSNAVGMELMFCECTSLKGIDVSKFDTSKTERIYDMFYGCENIKVLNLGSFNLSSLTAGRIIDVIYDCDINSITMPKNMGSSEISAQFIKDILSALNKDVNWTDVTANKKYTGKPSTLIAGHKYIRSNYSQLTSALSSKDNTGSVTLTAKATGGSGKYTYKFIVYNKTTKKWGIVQDYSSKNVCTWNKSSSGDRVFYVDIKDENGEITRSNAVNVNVKSVSKPTSTLTTSTTSVNVGGKLTLTAKASQGSGKYTYKFLIYNPATKQWAKLQDFSGKNTFTWTAGSAGNRQFYVDVKDSNGNVTRSKVVNVAVGKAQVTTKLSVKATASITANKVGGNVNFAATGNGGAGGYTYKFIVYNKTTKKWAKLKDFGAVNKLTWKAGSAGERQFYVDVKDSNGTVVRSQVLNVKTTK